MRLRNCVLILLFINILPFIARSQQNSGRLSDLYRYVDRTDSLLDKAERTFYLEKFLKDDYNYKEKWSYSLNDGKIIFFQVDYSLDSTEFTEIYYLKRGSLVCSEEYEKVNYAYNEDALKWGGVYYFESTIPKHVVTLGSKSYSRLVNPESLVLTRFEKRYSELKRHLPMLP